ncbi:MAG TPA: amino acid adenylation domain-containing protein [Candidatus Kapabacteria bacterium]|nr:amino acid adenylation domain-containing protein [Candidatus Kapabacteria bacterium]
MKKTFGQDKVLLALEGHGREEILAETGIDISRTVGWFTSIYPVSMDMSYSGDLGRQIKEIKEKLRRIPNKGVGYGILKYLTDKKNKKEIEFKLKPQISFNYLGQFDADVKQMSSFEMAKESPGNPISTKNKREYEFDINGMISYNRLVIGVSYNHTHFKAETMASLTGNLQSELRRIISYCSVQEKREFTPSDFTYKSLSIDYLNRLMQLYTDVEDIYPLTPMQEGMLFHALVDEKSHSYFEQMSYRLEGKLDIHITEKSLNELFKRHEILRTAFIYEEVERPLQVVLSKRAIDFYYEDIRSIDDKKEKEFFIAEFKEKDKRRSFVLSKSALMRVSILQLADSEYEFIWSFHHILMDGWCIGILNSEFFEIYSSYLGNRPYRLPDLKPYRTYIQWLEKQNKEASLSYWENYLDSYEEQVSMPRTNIIKNEPGKLGEINRRVSFLLDRDKTVGLNKLAAVNNVTLNVVTQVLWGIILGKYNGKEDVVFGAVVSGRTSELDGIESMVGLFINTIPVRIQFNEHMNFNYLLQKIQQEALTGEPYHYNPLAEIQSISSLKQNLLDHIFIFENYPIAERIEGYGKEENKSGKSLSVRLLDVEIFEQTNYDFNVLLGGSDQLSIIFQYNANVYERSFVERIGQHFSLAVDQVIKNGGLEIKKLNLLTEEEKSLLLYRFNNTAVEYPKDKSIHLLFQEQAEQIPDSIALIGPLLSIEENGLTSLNTNAANMLIQQSYNELNKQSIRLAHMLQTKGVGPDTIVAIMMERSVEMIIGILGILAAGGAYLPIDPEYPQARIDYMLKDSGAKLMIGRGEERKSRRAERNFIYISFSSNHASSNLDSSLPRFHNSDSSNSAYVIYTSGSTGKPKGVMVGHRNIMNFNQGIISHIPFSPGKAILALTTISFDIFVLETFLPLLNGLKVVIANEEQQKDPSLLGETIVKHCLDMLQVTPSTLHMLISHNGELHCLQGLKELMVGGEAFPDHLFTRVKEAFKGNIYNMYGPTETTVWSAVKNLTLEETVNIGTPIANTQIFIVDRCNRLLPIGASGELCIGGDGVARGYLNRPELTSEKFCRHLWVERPRRGLQHSKLYRTGDLARCLPDGNIQFLGRIDQQVKVRGFRIELGEIESRLLECEGIKEAVVVIKEGDGADKYICAYIVSHPGNVLSDMKLREELAAKLPYYMIPSYIIQLERIPLTPNGKIDRNALPAPAMGEGEAGTAPRNDIEKKLAGIWSEVLGMAKEKPGIDHNFFQIGGHSLKAVIMISRIHKVFNVIISLVDFFQRPTIRQLSEYIKKAESDRFFSIEPAEKKEYYPLSSSQKRLLFLQQLEEFNVAYNMTAVLEWHGVLNREGVESTFQRLIARHESFRTSFHTHNGQAVQQIHPQVKFEIEYNHEADIDTGTKNFIKPFDLGQAPLLKVRLSEISPGRHLLMVDMHHIISDGVSVQLAMRDFMRLYGGEDLPPLGFQYKDYSQWQNEPQQKEILKKQRGYWIEEFAGDVPVLSLPLDYPRPLLQSFDGETVHFELNTEETRGLRATAKKIQGTLYMVLLALYTVFLAKMTGQEDIVVGTPVAGRRHKDLEEIIGNFVNTLALRNRLEGGMTFKDLLDKVKVNLLQAFENQEHPYEDLIEEVGVKRDTSRNPLFDAALALHNVDMPGEISWASSGNIKIKPVSIPGKTSKFDLTLQVIEGQEKIDLEFEYCNKLFMPSTIRRFVEYFKGILKEVLPEPAIRLREISIISPQEKQQLLAAFNHTQSQYPEYQTIDRLFGEQAVRTPDAISVAYNDNTITYRELECRAGQVTDYLGNKCGLKAGELAAILANRSENTIIGMLGILKAGGAYLPIDPDYPQERIDYILQDSGAKLLIVANDQEDGKVKSWEGEKILLEEISKLPKSSSCSRTILASDLLNPRNIAYIIYTSGSTGRPKGVMVEHRNVVRLFFHEGCFFEFTGRDIWTMFHSPCFDFSVWEMYGALLFGGKVIVVSKMMARQPARYLELLKSRGVTVLNQTPSAFYALEAMELQSSDKKLHLRYVIFGGEALHPIKLEKWRERYPETRLINMFGITETTVHVTYRELSAGDIRQDVRHIGRPIPTLSTYVVNRYQQLMPVGIVGELCVGGGGVARGYLNRVELTAERFVENSFEPGGRLYRSGDLAKITDGSDMEYLGRSDQQVQVRGFRVELGEIENQLLRHPLVKEAYVMDREDSTGEIYLCAYIAVDKEKGLDTAELRQHLHSRLPEYMIPSFFVRLETLPVTANGKVDRRALPAPAPGESKKNFTAPRDEIEKKLAEIWATVLGLDKNTIGIDNDFFELGGHSLKAGILAALIHKEMDVKIPLPEIFINSHIRDMAEYTRMAAKEKYLSIEPAKKKDYYALSSAQRRLYIMQHVDPSITAYNITQMYVIKGRLHIEKLVAAFRQLIQRHESLRTSFILFAGEPVQKIHENVEFEIKCHDDNTGGRTIMDNFIMPFDLHHAPLLRVGLIKVKEEEHILMIDMHHIITDGVSTNILVRDFAACYENNPLPGLKLQYKDFSEWQNGEFVKKDMARQKMYWVNRFSGTIPRLNLDTDYERSETKSFAGESIHFVIDKELCHQVITLTQETETSIFMFLLAVYNVLLYHYSKQEDILVGSPIIGRRHADLQHIVGMFVNMLVYRNYPAGQKTFRGFLEEVKQNALQAYENQDYQFEQLIVDLNLQGTVGRNPLFDAVFSMQRIDLDMEENVHMNKAHGDSKGISPLQITPYPFKRQTTPFELIMSAYETDDAIMMSLDYAARLFKHSTAEKIIRHFQEVINQVVANMDIELQNIRLSHQFKPLMDVNILEDQDDFGF